MAERFCVEEQGKDEVELAGDANGVLDALALLREELAGQQGEVVQVDQSHGPIAEVSSWAMLRYISRQVDMGKGAFVVETSR